METLVGPEPRVVVEPTDPVGTMDQREGLVAPAEQVRDSQCS